MHQCLPSCLLFFFNFWLNGVIAIQNFFDNYAAECCWRCTAWLQDITTPLKHYSLATTLTTMELIAKGYWRATRKTWNVVCYNFLRKVLKKSAAAAVSHGSNHNGGSIDLLPESAWNHSIQSKIIAKRRPEGGLVVQRWEKLKKSI